MGFAKAAAAAAMTVAVVSLGWAQDAAKPVRVRGTITAVDGQMLTVKTRDGTEVKAKLADNARINATVKATISDIKQGSFIGATGMPQADGSQRCVEIHIFPEDMRGAGEGHYPWDLQPQSTMTNGAVDQMVTAVNDHTLTLKYKDGEKKLVVGNDCAIVLYKPGDKAEIKPGAKIFVAAAQRQADGSLLFPRINVGRDAPPPM